MKLKELKNMIAEEYSRYLREQAPAPPMGGTPPVPPNAGGMPTPGPGISVGPDDIQVDDDGGNAEEMLQKATALLNDDALRKKIALNGNKRFISEHSSHKRMEYILKEIEKI